MTTVIGLILNAAVVVSVLTAGVLVLRSDPSPTRSGRLALVAGALVVATLPLLVAFPHLVGPSARGAADLSEAWSWSFVAIAAVLVAAAVRASLWRAES